VGSAGWPHPECEVKLIDEQGRPLSQPGQVGEVCVRSANLMKGYWQRGLAGGGPGGHGLQAGWFHTGDLGRRDADGAVTLVGRAKDMIISGGENIYPAEIENLLVGYPGVAEVAVVGWPDPHWGEVPVLAVEWLPQTEAAARDPQALLDHLQPRLARFKWPKRVVSVAAFPRSALGKVRKPDLLAQLLAESP
jgi:fatty-acyl-CoA synthase